MKTYCFFIIFLITVTHMYVALGTPVENNNRNYKNINPDYKLCRTKECINVASEILAKLNRTVDPCDNFYKFACGGWIHNHPVDERFSYVDVFIEGYRKVKSQLRELLEEPVKKSDTLSFRKAKHIFAQCMDIESNITTAVGNEAVIWNEYIKWLWNMTSDTWEEFTDKFIDWQSFSDNLHEHGFDNGLFTIRVTKDFLRNNSNNIIVITAPSMSLNNKRSQYTIDSLTGFYDPAYPTSRYNLDNYTRTALDIKNFAIELVELKKAVRQLDKKVYLRYPTIQQWQKAHDAQHPETNVKIDWHLTIQKLFATQGIAIEPTESLLINAHYYLQNLVPLLERTPSRIIINYMKWILFYKLMDYTKGSEDSLSRDMAWKTCVEVNNLNSAISHEYVKKYTSHLNIDAIREIASDVKDAVGDQIRLSTWMDEPTKHLSLEKLAYMKHEFIKPDWYSDEAIDKYYESVNASMGYFKNILSIYLFERKMMLRSLRAPLDKTEYELTDLLFCPYRREWAEKSQFFQR